MGSPVKRLEDMRFLRGRGQFVDDLTRENVLHAAILRSAVAHGRIRSIDSAVAGALPGVHAVLTAEDIGPLIPFIPLRLWALPELAPFGQPVIADKKVRHVGEAVAIVLAETQAVAEDALSLIEIDIEPLPAVADRRVACEAASLLFEEAGSNCPITYTASKGDADAAFAQAPYRRREQFAVQRHSALPMEPRGVLAEWDAEHGQMTVWGVAKVPFVNRRILAALMGISEHAIDMLESRRRRRVRCARRVFSRGLPDPVCGPSCRSPGQMDGGSPRASPDHGHAREADCDIEIACRHDGTILGLRGQVYVDAGAYLRTAGSISPRNVAQFMSGPIASRTFTSSPRFC